MKNSTMSSYKHIWKERDYKGGMDDERDRKKKKDKDKSSSKHSSHSHKSKRSDSPHERSRHTKSPLKSKIGYDNSDHHRSQKHHESEINESYEELSRRKRKLESELRALDLEEAAEREAENKKARKEKSNNKRETSNAKSKSVSRSDHKKSSKSKSQNVTVKYECGDSDRKSSKSKSQNVTVKYESDDSDRKSSKSKPLDVTVKVEKEKHKGHSSKSSENDKSWGKASQESKNSVKEKEKPNFEVSGKLAEETNTYNGVVIKYNEPSEARKPKRKWRLYPFKGDSDLPYIPIHRQSAYLFGRTRLIADIPIDHPSCSKQHAVLQFRLIPYKREDGTTGRRVRPYIIDLESSNGTFVNNKKIEPRCYVELFEKDVIKFGYSSREYVLLHEESKNDEEDDDVLETND